MEIRIKDIMGCLPLLASILGNKYGVTVKIGGDTACTNGKVIQIPALPMNCDSETLMLVKGYTDHESAHIRHTDFAAIRNARLSRVEHCLWNAIEDWRVEQKICSIFPGCRDNLNRLIQKFFIEEDEAGAGKNPAFAIINYVLLTVRSWDVPEASANAHKSRNVLVRHYGNFADKLDEILNRVKAYCPDTAQAISYAREIVQLIGQLQPQEDMANKPKDRTANNENSPSAGIENNTKEASETISSGKQDYENSGISEENKTEAESDHPASSDGDVTDETLDVAESGNAISGDMNISSLPNGNLAEGMCGSDKEIQNDDQDKDTPQRQDILGEIMASLPEHLAGGIGEIIADKLSQIKEDNPSCRVDVAITGEPCKKTLRPDEKQEALRKSVTLRSRLEGLLQAQTLRKCAPARQGKIYTQKLYRLGIGNPKVFQKEDMKQGMDTAVHILLDRSGSMLGEKIVVARQACYAIAKSLEKIRGVAFAVSAFPAYLSQSMAVMPITGYGEKIQDNYGIDADGCTPQALTLWWMLQQLGERKERRKIVLLLTDGSPDDLESSNEALDALLKFGMEVYAVGIHTASVSHLHISGSRIIWELDGLPEAIFGFLRKALVNGGCHAHSH